MLKLTPVLTALALLIAAAPASAGQSGCTLKGARVVASKGEARVLARKATSGGLAGEQFYACLRSSGRLYKVAFVSIDPGAQAYAVRPIAFSGRYVALGVLSTDDQGEGNYGDIVVLNLTTGRRLLDKPAGEARDESETARVSDLVLAHSGRAAWIAEIDSPEAGATTYVVRAFDGRSVKTLARGAKIGARSLVLRGSTVTWTDGGSSKSATL